MPTRDQAGPGEPGKSRERRCEAVLGLFLVWPALGHDSKTTGLARSRLNGMEYGAMATPPALLIWTAHAGDSRTSS